MQPARAHVIHAQRALRANLLLHAQSVLVIVRSLQRPARKRVHVHRQWASRRTRRDACARWSTRAEGTSETLDWLSAVASTALSGTPGATPTPPTCPPRPSDKRRRVRSIRRRQVRYLRRNYVVEDAKPRMNRSRRRELVSERDPRLPDKQRRRRERSLDAGFNHLVERLVHLMRHVKKRALRPRKEPLLIHRIGVPRRANAARQRQPLGQLEVSIAYRSISPLATRSFSAIGNVWLAV